MANEVPSPGTRLKISLDGDALRLELSGDIDLAAHAPLASAAADRATVDVDMAGQPVVAAAAAQFLAAIALAVAPNGACADYGAEDCHEAHPATLRRAIAFIEEHAHQDISIADIAAAAFVTVRAVQLAFRRYLDTTPTAYLRRVRLDLAHHDLLEADPARETVTGIAYRWGFASPSRFAASYRAAHGIHPSQTLRIPARGTLPPARAVAPGPGRSPGPRGTARPRTSPRGVPAC